MRELGREHQVIAITHFPQVAALADHHYLISKGLTTEGRTVSRLEEVDADARISELVRMLGTSGAAAEAHARGLLNVEE
jgi:DNA repair protein RecN (Recombination protein N)